MGRPERNGSHAAATARDLGAVHPPVEPQHLKAEVRPGSQRCIPRAVGLDAQAHLRTAWCGKLVAVVGKPYAPQPWVGPARSGGRRSDSVRACEGEEK